MTDLEINIALAKAMGWGQNWDLLRDSYAKVVRCFDDSLNQWREFDYRDPVIFVAICKRWRLVVNFDGWTSGVCMTEVIGNWCKPCIEKSAALTVIELAKRGVK